MSLYTIVVEFFVKEEFKTKFQELILINAKESLKSEPGCMRFDVLSDDAVNAKIVLYEIYRSRSDFDYHSGSAHYHSFAAASEGMVTKKIVTALTMLSSETGANP